MARRLFGTDGVRGVANVDLSPALALALGGAAGRVLAGDVEDTGRPRPSVLIGRDPRRSGSMLAAALAAGFCSAGADVVDVGVIPTPGAAYLTVEQGATAGAVVSASHNPAQDNGIKFFGADGYKLSDETEAAIEDFLDARHELADIAGPEIGTTRSAPVLAALYEAHLVSTVGEGVLAGLKVVLDCANGAAFEAAPNAYRAAGAAVETIFAAPDGGNINERCGSTDPARLQEEVVKADADLGLAFDGDADRVVAVDGDGTVVDGDQILAIVATSGSEPDGPAGRKVVATVMANLGFRQAMDAHGIETVECQVGDRYVIEAMRRDGIALGGEQSGHIIFAGSATTGDGLLTGLKLMQVMAATGRPLSDLATVMARFPQVLVNVRVRDRHMLDSADAVWKAVDDAKVRLGVGGRVLLRPSGTEPLIRVMVEAETAETAEGEANRLAQLVASELGITG